MEIRGRADDAHPEEMTMGQLTVTFKGICTHFRALDGILPEQKVHRAVLVNARGENVINGIRIPPHVAKMTISPTTTNLESQTFQLQGVSLSIAGGSPPLNYLSSYDTTIPSLANQLSEIETLSEPMPSLLFGESWPAIAAYFTMEAGTFSACVTSGAADAKLVLETDEIDVVTLVATRFPDAPPAPFDSVQLLSPAVIEITNLVENPADELIAPRSHFFLHYLLADRYPSSPQAPLSVDGDPCDLALTVDAGCSDSNYP
jgi:hypothetical protein